MITEELGLSMTAQDEEAFCMEAAHKAGLSVRQLDRLMRDFTEAFVSEIRKGRLSGRARRSEVDLFLTRIPVTKYPDTTTSRSRLVAMHRRLEPGPSAN